MISKCSALLLLLFCCWIPLAADPAVLFEKPTADSRIWISDHEIIHDTGKKVRTVITDHPVAFINEFSVVNTPDGKTYYHNPDIVLTNNGQDIERLPEIPVKHIFGIIAAGVILAALLWQWFNNKKAADWEIVLIPLLIRIIAVLAVLCRWDNVYSAAVDEYGYFETINDMLNGQWHNQWRMTVGTGFFYLPFILVLDAGMIYDLIPYFNYFSALLIAPAILVLGFLILRKLGISKEKTLAVMLIWAIYPLIAFHLEDWDGLNFQHFFLFSELFTRFEKLVFYAFCINSGFNAMSDTPGLLIIMGTLYLTLAMPPKCRYAALTGAMFGFACLIRINYIILSPLFAFIMFEKFKHCRKQMICAALCSTGCFIAAFLIQFICNTIQFGSPLTFGYVLHYPEYAPLDRPAAGFTWHTFSKLTFMRYLLQANLPIFAIGCAALWTMRRRFNQQVLILLSIPVILFFCGYSHTFCDARRFVFPAFAGLLMAIAASDAWNKTGKLQKLLIIGGLLFMVIFSMPWHANWRNLPLYPDGAMQTVCQFLIPLYAICLTGYFFRIKLYRTAVFMMLSVIFYYSPPEVLGAGMFLLLLWSFGGRYIYRKLRCKYLLNMPPEKVR